MSAHLSSGNRCVTTVTGVKVGVSYSVAVFDRIKVPEKLLAAVTTSTTSISLDSLYQEPREVEVSTEVGMQQITLKVVNGVFVPFIASSDASRLVQEGYGRYIPIVVEVVSADAYIHLLTSNKELQDATDLFVATPEDQRDTLPQKIREMAEMNLAEENWLAGLQYPEDKPDMVVYRIRPPSPTLLDVCRSITSGSRGSHLKDDAESAIKTCNIFQIDQRRRK